MPGRASSARAKHIADGRHTAVIEATIAGKSMAEAAKEAGIARRTAASWISDPDHPVGSALAEIRESVIRRARGRLRDLADVAVDALREVLTDPEAPHAAKISAVREVLGRVGIAETTRQEHEVSGAPPWVDDLTAALRDSDEEEVAEALGGEE